MARRRCGPPGDPCRASGSGGSAVGKDANMRGQEDSRRGVHDSQQYLLLRYPGQREQGAGLEPKTTRRPRSASEGLLR